MPECDMELIVEKMYKNIMVEPEKSDDDRKVAAFRINYRDRSPEAARNVTAELASKYVNAQVIASTQTAETTREFLDNQLNQAKTMLDALEKQRLDIMMQNVETLPESSQGLIAQLQGLRQREETISKEKETLMSGKRTAERQHSRAQQSGAPDRRFRRKGNSGSRRQASRIEDTPAYAQLVQKRAELTAKLENLKLTLREKHPDVIKAQNDIDKVNDEIESACRKTRRSASSERAVNRVRAKPNCKSKIWKSKNKKPKVKSRRSISKLMYKDQELRQNAGQISVLESKINTIPNVKVALEGINNSISIGENDLRRFFEKEKRREFAG